MSNPLSLNGFNGSPWLGFTENLSGWIDAAAAAGFPLFAPDCPSLHKWVEAGRSLSQLAQTMCDAGVGCQAVTVAAMLDGSPQQDTDLAFAARAAQALGARFLQVNVAAATATDREAALVRACETVAGTGLRIAIEYMPITPLATLAETVALVDAVGRDKAGALVDIWHHSHDPEGWETLATCPLDAIAYVEFCDARAPLGNDLMLEMMDRRALPGEGVLDCTRFAELLKSRGYSGMVSVEVLDRERRGEPGAPLPPHPFAKACAQAAQRYFPQG